MARTVQVKATTLQRLLERVRDTAKPVHSVYDRKNKTYLFDDAMWKQCDPYEFKLYDELRRALARH